MKNMILSFKNRWLALLVNSPGFSQKKYITGPPSCQGKLYGPDPLQPFTLIFLCDTIFMHFLEILNIRHRTTEGVSAVIGFTGRSIGTLPGRIYGKYH